MAKRGDHHNVHYVRYEEQNGRKDAREIRHFFLFSIQGKERVLIAVISNYDVSTPQPCPLFANTVETRRLTFDLDNPLPFE